MEELQLSTGKLRRRYSPEHSIFAAGNALRNTKFYRQSGVDVDDFCTAEDAEQEVFVCRLFSCNGIGFRSIHAYEEHYDLTHRNICIECHRSFLSFRLLDLHISETHDAFFRILAQRQPMYKCIVDGCVEVYTHPDKRLRHLVNDHGYPPTFTFDARRKKPLRSDRKAKPNSTKAKALSEEDQARLVEVKKTKAKARKEKRRVQQKEKKRCDVEMDVVAEVPPLPGDDKDRDANMTPVPMKDAGTAEDMLVERMTQLQIPKTVSFGRRQQRRR